MRFRYSYMTILFGLLALSLITFRSVPSANARVAHVQGASIPCQIDTYKWNYTTNKWKPWGQNPGEVFIPGDRLNITTYCEWPPYTINITDPDGTLHLFTSTTERFTTVFEPILKIGTWTITIEKDLCQAMVKKITVITLTVVPEVPIGVAALIACFAGLGYHVSRTRRRRKE